jgi:hypothetical protein
MGRRFDLMADVKFGRQPTPPELRVVLPELTNYVPLKPGPASFDVSGLGGTYPMDLNDRLSDCLCAAAAHMVQVFTELVDGTPYVPSDAEVLAMYQALGYVPADPSTDQGGTIPQALEVWRSQGIAGHTIKGWAEIPMSNQAEVVAACATFQGLYAGLNVPQSAVDQFKAGQPWRLQSPDGGIAGGHCVPVLGYDARGVTLVTWGRVIRADWDFFYNYFDEVAVVIPADFDRLAQGKLIDGDTEAQLIADLDAIGGNITPGPARPPAPGPPTPGSPPPGLWDWLRRAADVPEDVAEWLWSHR